VVNRLLYEKLSIADDVAVLKLIFEDMLCEAIDNYTAIFDLLPLENLNPATILPYMPPGRNQKALEKPFWQKVRSLVSRETFVKLFVEDGSKIYERICVEFCYELDQPGKALVILQDALQSKLVHACDDSSLNLTAIALEAAERAIFNQKIKPQIQLPQLPESRKERVKLLFTASGNGGAADPIAYFKETKWIFALSKRLYERYLAELRWFLQTQKEVGFVFELCERHADPDLLALTDEDVV